MQIQDLVVKTERIEWKTLQDLQPENLKVNLHTDKVKKSLIENGFARAIYVWTDPQDGITKIIDGHCRKSVLLELEAEGYDIPQILSCTFLSNHVIQTEQDAVKYLLSVFNTKTNPLDTEELEKWLDEVDIEIDEVNFDELDTSVDMQELDSAVDDLSGKNKEIDIDKIDTSECKIVFKFDELMYESVLNRINTIKQDEGISTNELLLIKLLENYGT
jgi:hypothetical protein